ncbi:hypothetical protein D9M68_652150 [compost metagenome]
MCDYYNNDGNDQSEYYPNLYPGTTGMYRYHFISLTDYLPERLYRNLESGTEQYSNHHLYLYPDSRTVRYYGDDDHTDQ